MLALVWIVAVLAVALALAYVNAPGLALTIAIAVALGVAWFAHTIPGWLALALTLLFVLLAIPGNVPALRRKLVSDAVLATFPQAVAADVRRRSATRSRPAPCNQSTHNFSGRPNWRHLLDTRYPSLTADEQRFLDHDVEELCAMVTDWETTHSATCRHACGIPIKDRGFLGMSIAKE